MRKYLWAAKLSFSALTTYRFNFFLGRVRNIIVLLLLYFVWLTLSRETGQFAGFTTQQLTTYVFLAAVFNQFIFGGNARTVAFEINDGRLSQFLVKPVNHCLFNYFRELPEKLVPTLSAVIEFSMVGWLLGVDLFVQSNTTLIVLFIAALLLAHVLYYLTSYLMSMIAFWSREAMGPWFLFQWFLGFAAGEYFPLRIVGGTLFGILSALPFMYMLYAPLMLYLGEIAPGREIGIIGIQLMWIVIVAVLVYRAWARGLRRYSGEGM